MPVVMTNDISLGKSYVNQYNLTWHHSVYSDVAM